MAAQSRWQESTAGFERIDRENGIIHGVKVLGLQSANDRGKRRYLKEASVSATALYEGRKIYIDHISIKESKPKPRQTAERWGKLVNVRPDPATGELFGDLHYLKSHRMTEAILEAAERFNDFGLSHDASGKMRTENGENVVYEIAEVHSVDIVQDPATNRNLFEGRSMATKRKVSDVFREHVKVSVAAKLLARLTEMDDQAIANAEMEMEDGAEPMNQVGDAFRAAVMSIVDSEMSVEPKIEKIKMLLDVHDQVKGPEEMSESVETKELQAEIARLREQNEQFQKEAAKSACIALLESKKVEVTDLRVSALLALPEADREALAENFPQKTDRPASSAGRFTESATKDSGSDSDFGSIESIKRALKL